MGREASWDKGGDYDAWRDLVARLEMPSPVDPVDAPWPDRENLRSTKQPPKSSPAGTLPAGAGDSPAHPAGDDGVAGSAGGTSADRAPGGSGECDPPAGQGEGSSPAGRADSRGSTAPEPGPSASRSRIVRRASFIRSSDLAGEPDASDIAGASHKDARPGSARDDVAGQHREAGSEAADDSYLDTPTTPDISFLDFLDDEEDPDEPDNRYVPPPVPPMPKLDPVAKGAWAALFGGPGYLLIATMLGWQVQGWAELVAIAAFITGFVVLVSRLGDGPSRRDGPDQGAVVLPAC